MRAIFSPLFRSLWQELSSTGFIISCQLFCYGCGWRKWQHSQGHGGDTCKTFWDMFALCIVFTRCTRLVLSLDHQFSWAMGYLLFEVQILIFRSILLLEIKASGSVLHPSREPLHSTSLWRVKWRQCLVLSRELWSYNWYIDQGEREFFFWRYLIVFIL